MRNFATAVILLMICRAATAQTIELPNYAIKSHPTLEIRKIELKQDATVFYMSIENRIQGGTFCADRNISVVYPDGSRSLLISSEGIPVCPDSHKFKSPGERLDFLLVFPALKPGIKCISLEEECSDNCFSFYGIILDNQLNSKIDDAFALAERNEPSGSMVSFIKIADEAAKNGTGAEGVLYLNIIKLARDTGNSVKAAEWYKKLGTPGIPWANRYILYLNSQGIRY